MLDPVAPNFHKLDSQCIMLIFREEVERNLRICDKKLKSMELDNLFDFLSPEEKS